MDDGDRLFAREEGMAMEPEHVSWLLHKPGDTNGRSDTEGHARWTDADEAIELVTQLLPRWPAFWLFERRRRQVAEAIVDELICLGWQSPTAAGILRTEIE